MQVARLRYSHPRSVVGKLQQMARALQLETQYSKQEILTYYVNHAPFGGTVEGVEAASLTFFGYPSRSLTHAQAALLAVLPQAPSRFRPDRYPATAERARNKLLRRLATQGIWPAELVADALLERVAVSQTGVPTFSPLLARRLHQGHSGPLIQTFIDYNLQASLELLTRDYVPAIDDRASAAVLVMENATGKVVAYLGSADFEDNNRFGHVDMVRAQRSPGSTFKPFIYGMSLDNGLIHSESLLHDAPVTFGDYTPENFNRRFAGPVSVSSALQQSLNIPAVQLLEHLSPDVFYSRLVNAGVRLTLPAHARPSLALALGGFATDLQSLVQGFAAIGNQGYAVEPRLTPDQPFSQHPLLSPGSAYIVNDILQNTADAGLPPQLAMKTGTSYGNRDSWAVGTTGVYTAGVWVGRPDNKPMSGHHGRHTATPLLAQVFRMLRQPDVIASPPSSVTRSTICWPTGLSDTADCDLARNAWVLDHTIPPTLTAASLEAEPAALRSVMVGISDLGLRVPAGCNVPAAIQPVHVWPEALEPWITRQWRRDQRIPLIDPRCDTRDSLPISKPIEITGVQDGQRYQRHAVSKSLPHLKLQAVGGTRPYYWFVDGQLAEARTSQLNLSPEQHHHQVVLLDQFGHTAMVSLHFQQ